MGDDNLKKTYGTKEFDVSFNSVKYMYFRLVITNSIYHDSTPETNPGFVVAIEDWELETVQ